MILTLIGVGLIILGVGGACKVGYITKHRHDITEELYDNDVDIKWYAFSAVNFLAGIILTFICVSLIISAHTGVEVQLQQQQIQYETLCNEYNMIKDEIETSDKVRASYAQVMNSIAEWNQETISEQYWSKNPWTNWLYNKKLANARKLIEIE